jgi:hypothetical protein
MRRVLWVVVLLAACGEEAGAFNYEPRPLSTDASARACTSNAQCGAGETCFVYESPTSEQSLCASSSAPCDFVTCAEDTARCIRLPHDSNVVCLTVMDALHGT